MDIPAQRRVPYARILAVVLAYLLGAVQALAALNLFTDVIHVYRGLLAFSGLAGIVCLGIVFLSFMLGVPALYARGERRGTLVPRVLLVTGIQALLFPVLHVMQYVVNYFLRPGIVDFIVGGAGLVVGAVCVTFSVRLFRAAKRARREAFGI